MLKHFLLVLLLAGLWSFSYSCSRGNGGRGGNGGNSRGNGNGGNGGSGGNGRKRSSQQAFSLDFALFDADGDGKISRAEFLDLQPDHESLFDKADTNGDDYVDCKEFSAVVDAFGGEANCEQ